MKKKYKAHVYSHTHWDREWHLTFQQFRIKLIEFMDKLLDLMEGDPEYKHFYLDGQCIILKDYLEIRPENESRIKKLCNSGRLLIGPWYNLIDEFLVSPESIIRNLLFGRKICAEFGGVTKIGYNPDTFGHISQLPQILRGFGIDNSLVGRGIDHPKMNFIWQAPDGSEVFTINIFYCSFMVDGFLRDQWRFYRSGKELLEEVEKEKEEVFPPTGRFRFIDRAPTNILLLPNGFDHYEGQPQLPRVLKEANELSEEVEYIHSHLNNYIKDVKKRNPHLDLLKGEFRDLSGDWLLQGTFSSRIHLKQQNEECQNLLEKLAEPLSVFSWIHGDAYPEKLLEKSWDFLLQNHPHDSICGCSADEVHREMEVRFASSRQISRALIDKSIGYLMRNIDSKHFEKDSLALLLFNPLQWENNNVIITEFELWESWYFEPFQIVDENDNPVFFEVLERESGEKFEKVEGYTPGYVKTLKYKIALDAVKIPGCGYLVLKLRKGEPKKRDREMLKDNNSIENDLLNVEFTSSGTLNVTDKENGRTYENLHIFEDGADAGDLYNY